MMFVESSAQMIMFVLMTQVISPSFPSCNLGTHLSLEAVLPFHLLPSFFPTAAEAKLRSALVFPSATWERGKAITTWVQALTG